ncbi:hypothetical protein L9F63_021512 [Diploptera punctata]|uniref:Uncharacterized protein n=1 Tax=Diploptera punctata TaxID=6984 RepID=A0AAD7ZQ65_DIPPU|nr:hypothetical protein L9F63_021512 [Diploptera punctata]
MSEVLSTYSREMTAIAFQRAKNKFEQQQAEDTKTSMARQEGGNTKSVSLGQDNHIAPALDSVTEEEDKTSRHSKVPERFNLPDHKHAGRCMSTYISREQLNPSMSGIQTNSSLKGILSSSNNSARKTSSRDINSNCVPYRHTSSVRFIDEGTCTTPVSSEHYYEVENIRDCHCKRQKYYRSPSGEVSDELCNAIKVKCHINDQQGDDDVCTPIVHKDSLDLISKRGISVKPNSSVRYRDRREHCSRCDNGNRQRELDPKDSLSLLVDKRRRLASSPDMEEGETCRKTRHSSGQAVQDNNRNASGFLKRRQDPNKSSRNGGNISSKMMSQSDDLRKRHDQDRNVCDKSTQSHWEAATPRYTSSNSPHRYQ